MGLTLDALPWLQILLAVLLTGIIYVTWAKIPSRQKQREAGERIIAKRLTRDYSEVRREFQDYFRKVFRLLVLVSLAFFAVNSLTALVIDVFLASQNLEFFFFGNPSGPHLPRWAAAVAMAFMMCSAGWLMIISFFYHNRAAKLALETKYEEFFRES